MPLNIDVIIKKKLLDGIEPWRISRNENELFQFILDMALLK
jgi:hypothetical protein